MYEQRSVAVVVPAYNEEPFVGEVLASVPEFVDRVYAVDDGSTDDTWTEIRRHVPRDDAGAPEARAADGGVDGDGRIVPIRHEENRGAGAALCTGYRRAREDGMDVTVAMDADGQMDPESMADLLDPVVADAADYAKGNRLADAEFRAEMPTFRLVGNWLLTLLTKVASGYWRVADPQNGYTAISHEALSALDLDAVPAGHDYTNDLLVRLNVAGMRVADVPMPAEYGEEFSTITYAEFVPVTSKTLLASFVWRLRRSHFAREFHPLVLFYAAGAVCAAAGLGWVADAVRRRRADDGATASAVGATVSLSTSLLLVLWAMVFDARESDPREVDRE